VRDGVTRIQNRVIDRAGSLGRQVLNERPAGGHVQHLQAATNGE